MIARVCVILLHSQRLIAGKTAEYQNFRMRPFDRSKAALHVRIYGTTWLIVSAIGSLVCTSIGFDTTCRSPLCAVALPDFEMRAPTITCGNCDNFIVGIMPISSVSVTVAGNLSAVMR